MERSGPGEPRFAGRPFPHPPGETFVQSLVRRGLPTLQRSIRYHRPRAPFCGIGQCTNCLVRVNGVPNVRGCRYVPAPGDRIETENSWPSPRFDVLGGLDLLFARGLDTLHGFRRPMAAVPLYHRVVRRLAGYGSLPSAGVPDLGRPGEGRTVDTLVIGGGTAGRAAARHLVVAGVRPTVVDRTPASRPEAGTDWLAGTNVVFLPPPAPGPYPFRAVAIRNEVAGLTVSARAVVVATGAYDGNLLFHGNDRPGVLTADGVRAITPPGSPPPFRRGVVFGGGERVADLLDRWGDHLEAVVAPGAVHGRVAERAARLEVDVFPRTLLLSVDGRARVRSIRLRPRGGSHAPFSISTDAVILAHRRLPTPQLFFQAGARMEWRGGVGAYYPTLDPAGTSTVPGLFAAGSTAGFEPGADSAASGAAAADATLGRPFPAELLARRVRADPPGDLDGYYRELLHGPPPSGKLVVCPCEDVLIGEIEEANRRGFRGVEVIKRYTSAGTGLCQGRYCLPEILLVLSHLEGRSPAEVGYITQRPPVLPVRLDALTSLSESVEEAT